MPLSKGVSVQGGLYPGESLSKRGLCPGGLCPRGSLSGGSLSKGSLSRGESLSREGSP